MGPNTRADVITRESQRSTHFVSSAKRNVYVRMLRVEVGCCDPLKRSAQVVLHKFDELPRLVFEVHPFAKLWRHNNFENAVVAGFLPCVQEGSNIDVCSSPVKPGP